MASLSLGFFIFKKGDNHSQGRLWSQRRNKCGGRQCLENCQESHRAKVFSDRPWMPEGELCKAQLQVGIMPICWSLKWPSPNHLSGWKVKKKTSESNSIKTTNYTIGPKETQRAAAGNPSLSSLTDHLKHNIRASTSGSHSASVFIRDLEAQNMRENTSSLHGVHRQHHTNQTALLWKPVWFLSQDVAFLSPNWGREVWLALASTTQWWSLSLDLALLSLLHCAFFC